MSNTIEQVVFSVKDESLIIIGETIKSFWFSKQYLKHKKIKNYERNCKFQKMHFV